MFDRTPPPGFKAEALAPLPLKPKSWRVTSLALDVSGSCNLACRYCAEAATQPPRGVMSEETLLSALYYLFSKKHPQTRCSIRLGSGEPLMAFPLLKKLAELIDVEKRRDFFIAPEIFLTTNGTLADRHIRNWLVLSGWHIKLSIDGPEFIHDRWRVTRDGEGTFQKIIDVVTEFTQKIPERFSVTAVLCQDSPPDIVFQTLSNLGVRRIELVPVVHKDKAILPKTDDITHYENFIQGYAESYISQGTKLPTLIRFENRVRRVMGYDVKTLPCGAGRSFLGVAPDGGLYPCFRFIGVDSYYLGNLDDGLDTEASESFQLGPGRTFDRRAVCSSCWAAPLCGGPCFACSEMFGPGDGQPIEIQCAYILADAKAAVWLVDQLRKNNPERLLEFIPGSYKSYTQYISK